MAAWRDDQQRCIGCNPGGKGIIGGGVTGVEGDQNIEIGNRLIADVTDGKLEIRKSTFLGMAIVEVHEIGATLDAVDLRAFTEEGGDRESKVAFAASHIGDAQETICGEIRFGGEMGDEFSEFLNLTKLGRTVLSRLTVLIGDAQQIHGASAGIM